MSNRLGSARQPPTTAAPVTTRLSTVDRLLPAWIGAAMAAGLALGRLVPPLAGWTQ